MDVKHGCMPNGFGHILFGKLKGLYNNETDPYYGDRIYIKPEEFGLQKFKHYIGRKLMRRKATTRCYYNERELVLQTLLILQINSCVSQIDFFFV
jgi:hypothetical protein